MGPLTAAGVEEGLRLAGASATGAPVASAAAPNPPVAAGAAALALGFGLLSFLSPCVLPLLPAYMGYISGLSVQELQQENQAPDRRRRVLSRSLTFILGLILVFTALGASATLVGAWLTAYRTPLTRTAGLLALAFGLHRLGLLHLPCLDQEFRPGLAGRPTGAGGHLQALAMGGAFALGWTPCVGPMLGSILILAGQ